MVLSLIAGVRWWRRRFRSGILLRVDPTSNSDDEERLLSRLDRWNQSKTEQENQRALDAAEARKLDYLPVGDDYVVEVVPSGYPINDLDWFGVVVLPFVWARRRWLRRDEFDVVVHRSRRFLGTRRVVDRRSGLTLDDARSVAQKVRQEIR